MKKPFISGAGSADKKQFVDKINAANKGQIYFKGAHSIGRGNPCHGKNDGKFCGTNTPDQQRAKEQSGLQAKINTWDAKEMHRQRNPNPPARSKAQIAARDANIDAQLKKNNYYD